jgi:hypothetical protein
MNTPRTVLLVLLLAGLSLALGSVGQARHARAAHLVRSNPAAVHDAAVTAEIARGRAASALQFAPGAANLYRLGL